MNDVRGTANEERVGLAYYNARLDNIDLAITQNKEDTRAAIQRIEEDTKATNLRIEENIDRLEQVILSQNTRPINYMGVVGIVFTFLALVGSFSFGLVNYMDLRMSQVTDQLTGISETQSSKLELFDEFRAEMHYEVGRFLEKDQATENILRDYSSYLQGLDSRIRDLEKAGG